MTQERIKWHLDIPVCSTLRGVKEHLHQLFLLNMRELLALEYAYDADNAESLAREMWAEIKERKGRRVHNAINAVLNAQ